MNALLLALVAAACFSGTPQDPERDIKSKDPLVRLAAIASIEKDGSEKAERLLTSALKDGDWEVRERAAHVLGGLGGERALKPLVKMALEAPTRRMRQTAARAAGAIDSPAAAARFLKKASGKTALAASEAFVLALRESGGEPGVRAFEKLMRGKEVDVREAAARAIVVGSDAMERQIHLEGLLAHDDLVVRAAVLDQIAARPGADDLAALSPLHTGAALDSTLERRLLRATLAVLVTLERDTGAERAKVVLDGMARGPAPLVRRARLTAALIEDADGLLETTVAVEALTECLAAKDEGPRAAAARGLRALGAERAVPIATSHLELETSARVRYQLLDTILTLRPPAEAEHVEWLAGRMTLDPDTDVRERAAVALGVPDLAGAGDALVKAFADADWRVVVSAAVSLGKTRETSGLPALVTLLGDEDWKLRGAAAVALGHANRRGAVEPLIGAVGDEHPSVARAAHEGLRSISNRLDVEQDAGAWNKWWEEHEDKHRFVDKAVLEERRKRYGYDVPDAQIYAGLDVVVFQSRGDHIEQLLERLEIEHRKTEASKVAEAALHPAAVYVANCTGEIEGSDVEPIEWFVRTGGSLFASCWALTHTVGRIAPGVLRKADTPGEVLDDVRAYACVESTLLNGVFPPSVVPIYHLEGAHLIEVLDPERAEVLIDSPDAAQRHGAGDLAAWFRAGHGVILDSANHFDLQGLELAMGLKKPDQVKAYAVDHMGLDYERLRAIAKEKFWKSANSASKHVPDLSAFRFVTNFVRAKRIGLEN